MTTNRETPAESSDRRTSKPWAPGEEAEARQRIRDEVAKGEPYVIQNADQLSIKVLGVTINDDDTIGLDLQVIGTVVRPYATATCKRTVPIKVPAKVRRADDQEAD